MNLNNPGDEKYGRKLGYRKRKFKGKKRNPPWATRQFVAAAVEEFQKAGGKIKVLEPYYRNAPSINPALNDDKLY